MKKKQFLQKTSIQPTFSKSFLDKEDLFFRDEEIKKIMKDLNKSKLQIKQHINNKKKTVVSKSSTNEGKNLRTFICKFTETVEEIPARNEILDLTNDEILSQVNDHIDYEEVKSSDQSFEEVKKEIKEKRKAYKESLGTTKRLKIEQIEDIKEQKVERKQYQENQILFQTLLLEMVKKTQQSIKQMNQSQPNSTTIQTNLISP